MTTYDARISEQEILTPPTPPNPRINGPRRYGARPDKAFLYRIPTQGERPVAFTVERLPETIQLDAATGILSGRSPERSGEYPMTFHARNAHGEDACEFTLVVGATLALTPPTGWNHWGGHASNISDSIIRAAADLFVEKGLADVGFQFIGIDDCWMRMDPAEHERIICENDETYLRKHDGIDFDKTVGLPRNDSGDVLPNGFFPDMSALVDHIHAYGLRAGIYSSPGPMTCQRLEGSADHEKQDAEQYAAWGFDLLKYDQCSAGKKIQALKEGDPGFRVSSFWRPMASFLEQTDRDFAFNLCQYGGDEPWKWAPGIGVHSWRIGGDLNHYVDTYFDQALRIATELREYNKPGQWNDPDFMYVGRQVQTRDNHFVVSSPTELDTNREYQYVTLWAMICAPFFFSTDVTRVSDFTIGLLTNPEVMAISQDERTHTARVIRDTGKHVAMVKELADGTKALAIFSRDADEKATISVGWQEIGAADTCTVRDVWRRQDLGDCAGGITAQLSPNGIALFVVG